MSKENIFLSEEILHDKIRKNTKISDISTSGECNVYSSDKISVGEKGALLRFISVKGKEWRGLKPGVYIDTNIPLDVYKNDSENIITALALITAPLIDLNSQINSDNKVVIDIFSQFSIKECSLNDLNNVVFRISASS